MRINSPLTLALLCTAFGVGCSPGGGGSGSIAPFPMGSDDAGRFDGYEADAGQADGTSGDDGAASDGDASYDVDPCVPHCQPGGCGLDGCGGVCGTCGPGETCSDGWCVEGVCGQGTPTVVGALGTPSPVSFAVADVMLTHKMDVDPHEDGCLTQVTITLGKQFGCTLRVEAGSIIAADGSFPITRLEFTADSQCPGFDDADEGLYDSLAQLHVAKVVPSLLELPGNNVAQSCVVTGFRVELAGTLSNSAQQLPLSPTVINVGGEFLSQGSTQESCPCVPTCSGVQCGDDGCGGSCGSCNAGAACDDETGICQCEPSCDGKVCGPDGCGGSCGSCDGFDSCSQGQCVACTLQCFGKVCGDDGCGSSCGACPQGSTCSSSGQCACVPDCGGKACGTDGCGGTCGTCGGSSQCAGDGTCACIPQCAAGSCSDGCGGQCGAPCSGGTVCNHASGLCESGLGSCDYDGFGADTQWVVNEGDSVMLVQNTATNSLGMYDQLQIEVHPDAAGKYPGLLSTSSIGADPETCVTCVRVLTGCLPDGSCTKWFSATSGSIFWVAFGPTFGWVTGTLNASLNEVTSLFVPIAGGDNYCIDDHDVDAFHL